MGNDEKPDDGIEGEPLPGLNDDEPLTGLDDEPLPGLDDDDGDAGDGSPRGEGENGTPVGEPSRAQNENEAPEPHTSVENGGIVEDIITGAQEEFQHPSVEQFHLAEYFERAPDPDGLDQWNRLSVKDKLRRLISRSNRWRLLTVAGLTVLFGVVVTVAVMGLLSSGDSTGDAANESQEPAPEATEEGTNPDQTQNDADQTQNDADQTRNNADQTQNDAGGASSAAAGPISSGTSQGSHWIKWELGERVPDQVEYHTTYNLNISSTEDGLWFASYTFPVNEAAFPSGGCLEDRPDCGNGEVLVEGELNSERDEITLWLAGGTFGDATGLRIFASKQIFVDPNAAPDTEAVGDGAPIPLGTVESDPS